MTQLLSTPTMSDFERDSTSALAQFQDVVGLLLGDLGLAGTRAVDINSALQLQHNLGWKLSRVAGAPDLLCVLKYMPGGISFGHFLAAAERAGANRALLERARGAMRGVEQLVRNHAGDRESLEAMVAGFADPAAAERVATAQRKAACQALAPVLGIQARTHFRVAFLAPSESPGWKDFAYIRGVESLRWIRPGCWSVASTAVSNELGNERPLRRVTPLAPDVPAGTVPIIEQFCSRPLPTIRRELLENSLILDQVVSETVGTHSAATLIMGECVRASLSRYRSADNLMTHVMLRVLLPCDVSISDVFIHRSLYGGEPPESGIYTELIAGMYPKAGEHARMPIAVSAQKLGKGPGAARSPEVPRLPEMAAFAFERTGWEGSEFDLYRVRLEYPPIASAIVMRFPLLEAPADNR